MAHFKFLPFILSVFILPFTIHTTPTYAAAGDHGAGLGLGHHLLMGDFGHNVSNGLGFNLNYQYEASPLLALFTTFHYASFSNSADTNSLRIMGLTPDLKVNLAYIDKLAFFTQGGLGLFKVSQTIGALSGSVTTFGFNLGTGLDLALDTHFHFSTSLTFHNIFSKNDASMDIGGTFIGLFLSAMYIF